MARTLGVVLIDNIDSDGSFVALGNIEGVFRGIDVKASFQTQEAATKALELALQKIAAHMGACPPGEASQRLDQLMGQNYDALIAALKGGGSTSSDGARNGGEAIGKLSSSDTVDPNDLLRLDRC